MKTSLIRFMSIGSVILSLALSSCVDPYYGGGYYGGGYGSGYYGRPPAQGTVTGALLGAAAGGIIGNQSHRGLQGAAIGGLLGALAGGAIQNSRQYRQPVYNSNYGCGPGGYGYNNGCQPSGYYNQPSSYNPYAFGNWH